MARRTSRQLAYARAMRRAPTWAELRLWNALRRSQLGVRFRRQEPIGPYIADFVCHSHRLVVEVDGMTHHFGDEDYALRRDRWLREGGWTVIHFSDDYVYRNLVGALEVITKALGNPEVQWDLD